VLSDVLRERAAHIVNFVKLAFLVAPDVTLISAGVDEFSFAALFFRRHNPFLPVGFLLARLLQIGLKAGQKSPHFSPLPARPVKIANTMPDTPT
jgi:hypothetical protein